MLLDLFHFLDHLVHYRVARKLLGACHDILAESRTFLVNFHEAHQLLIFLVEEFALLLGGGCLQSGGLVDVFSAAEVLVLLHVLDLACLVGA